MRLEVVRAGIILHAPSKIKASTAAGERPEVAGHRDLYSTHGL